MTKPDSGDNSPDLEKPDGKSRRSRRVTWTPTGNPGDGADTVPTSDSPQAWGDVDARGAEQSNDERLGADKPPHWG